MITMNEINEQFNEVFETNNTLFVPNDYKNKSSYTPFDEAQFYIQQVKKLNLSSDTNSASV